ncbi:MAG: undecaprenyl-diphosphate phosphatase [Firmicutes bacterium]|jgi:undecaprenyl-diphosphatase|nr:undecaprenyl-diphosphate phosphatase [Bacillota bacterium]
MNTFAAILLGIIQGLTEFLPVSSSGHLVIFQKFLGIESPGMTMEIFLHFGTLLSIFWVFRKDFIALFSFYRDRTQKRFLMLLIIGVIPTGLIGLVFKSWVEQAFQSTLVVGLSLLVTGGILFLIRRIPPGKNDVSRMRIGDALWIGTLQGVAVIPGISRSGSTIAGALWRGLDRETAVRYSFILAAPVILGATILEAKDLIVCGIEKTLLSNYLVGGLFAFGFGVIAIKLFINLLQNRKFHYFSYYCWIVGGITVLLSLLLS